MGDLILGPAGALPPGEWAVGAQVAPTGDYGGLFVEYRDCGEVAVVRVADDGVESFDFDSLCLDLTTGPLDFGTRALLALVAPSAEQPLCAPGWETDDEGCWWLVCGPFGKSLDYCMGSLHTDPRRSLALALEAARSAKAGGAP